MKLVSTESNLPRSLSGLTGLDHVANQVFFIIVVYYLNLRLRKANRSELLE